MKTLLAILLSFIVTEAPVLAIHGGYSLGGANGLTGTYAGVLIPTGTPEILVKSNGNFGSNAFGLFSLSVPTTGFASGQVLIFTGGNTFTGTITGIADPSNSSGFLGVLSATYDYNLYLTSSSAIFGITTSSEALAATAEGTFDASTVQNANSSGGLGLDLDGSSEVSVDQGFVSGSNGNPILTEKIEFSVEGFQQSATATTTTTGT